MRPSRWLRFSADPDETAAILSYGSNALHRAVASAVGWRAGAIHRFNASDQKPHCRRGPADVQSGAQSDSSQPSRFGRYPSPADGGGGRNGPGGGSAFFRHSRPSSRSGAGGRLGRREAHSGADRVSLHRRRPGSGERDRRFTRIGAGHPSRRRAGGGGPSAGVGNICQRARDIPRRKKRRVSSADVREAAPRWIDSAS